MDTMEKRTLAFFGQEATYPAAGYRTRSPWLCGLCHSLHEGVSAGERGGDQGTVLKVALTLPSATSMCAVDVIHVAKSKLIQRFRSL